MKYDIEFNEADYCKAAEVPLKTNPEEEIQLPAKVKSGNRGDKDDPSRANKSNRKNCYFIIIGLIGVLLIGLFLFLLLKAKSNILHEDDIVKPLSDDRKYRIVRLENNLDVVLISDVNASKSSASLTVGVGSYADDNEVPGLAHFCEHMLFLGSKTYAAGEFDNYLVMNSGFNNAYTESDKTTYYFEVEQRGFNKSLHMFSRMFAEPSFNKSYMEKELNAVNSEHEKNLNSDAWRKYQLLRGMSNPEHPNTKFSTGSNQIFKNLRRIKLIKLLRNFYDSHYTPNNMKLAIVSNLTLDSLQDYAQKYFSDIRPDASNAQIWEVDKNIPAYRNSDLGKITWYKRVSADNILDIVFVIDSLHPHYRSKPLSYFNYLIKYTGKESLLRILKDKQYANKIDTGYLAKHSTFAQFEIALDLTVEGLKNIETVLKIVFNYINLIKSEKIKIEIYDEIRSISELNFKFLDKNEDYSSYLSSLSTNMFLYDYKDIIYGDYVYSVFDKDLIEKFLNQLTIYNALILTGTNVDLRTHPTFKNIRINQEPWYGTEYFTTNIKEKFKAVLNSYPISFTNKENISNSLDFKLRNNNKLISKVDKFATSCDGNCQHNEVDPKTEDYAPINLRDDLNLKIFYKIDNTFKAPKTLVNIHITTEQFTSSPKDFLYMKLLNNYIDYFLSSAIADATDSGNSIEQEFDRTGIFFNINAYSDLVEEIMRIVIDNIFKLNMDHSIFNQVVSSTEQSIKSNIITKPAFKNKLYFDKLITYNNTIYTESLENIKTVNFETFMHNYKMLFSDEVIVRMLFYGNVNITSMENIINRVTTIVPNIPYDEKRAKSYKFILNSIHLQKLLDDITVFQVKNDSPNEINHAVSVYFQIGERDILKNLYIAAVDKCIGNVFYENLRTVHQLGYIASGSKLIVDSMIYFRILVQGTKKNPNEITEEIFNTIKLAEDKMIKCEEKFQSIIDALRSNLQSKDNNLKERSSRIWGEIFKNTYEFNRAKKMLGVLDKIDYATVLDFFKSMFIKNPNGIIIHNYSSTSKVPSMKGFEYKLNPNVSVNICNTYNCLDKQDYVSGHKNIKFSQGVLHNLEVDLQKKGFSFLKSKKSLQKKKKSK